MATVENPNTWQYKDKAPGAEALLQQDNTLIHIVNDVVGAAAGSQASVSASATAGVAGTIIGLLMRLRDIFVSSTIRVNAGAAAPGQTLLQFTGKIALSGAAPTTVTLQTTPGGKTFYITDLFISHDSAQVIDVQVQAGGVTIFRAPIKGDTAPLQLPGIETQPQTTTGLATTILWPTTATPPNAYYFIAGFLQ